MCDKGRNFLTILPLTEPAMLRRVIVLGLALPLAAAVGCDGCSEPLGSIGDDGTGVNPIDIDNEEDKEARRIFFDGQSPQLVYRGATASLRFVVTGEVSFQPKANVAVTVDSTGFGATVTGSSFVTDNNGAILVPVRADADGTLTVTATMTDISGIDESASATVTVVEDPAATLAVSVSATGTRIPVTTAVGHVYVSAGAPTCAVLLAQSAPPMATFTATFAAVPQTQTFANQSTGRRASVLVTGHGQNGAIVARGCAELDRLNGGQTNTLAVNLTQAPTTVTGDYDVLMHMALGQALPDPYDTILGNVTGVLADPAGIALFFIMREAGLEFDETDNYDIAEENPDLFPIWRTLRTSLDNVLRARLGQRYVDVTDVGAGLRDVVTDFEVGGRFAIADNGVGAYSVDESWRDAVVFWPLPCTDASDLACARRAISLDDPRLAPVTSSYGATIEHAPVGADTERYSVVTDEHGVQLNYGAFVLAILNQVVFPGLPEGIAADSLSGVLGNLVRCQDIASGISSDAAIQSLVSGFCNVGITAAATFAENQLIGLQVDATNPTLGDEGLAASGSFTLRDADRDTEIERLENFNFTLGWYRPDDADFTQDIQSPITGDGVRARLECVDDSVCGSGTVCAPIPSYLKVAAVDFGCAPARGVKAGGASCSTDNECASGLCDPSGLGGATICFEACDAVNDCSAGLTCSELGAIVDLDTVMVGLGDVVVSGCAAP